MVVDLKFFKGKKILITGHTGFKGSWLVEILIHAGAEVFGYSLFNKNENLHYNLLNSQVNERIDNILNIDHLRDFVFQSEPDIIFHLAAQSLVIDSYNNPINTYQTNVLGTLNVLEIFKESNENH